MPDINVNDVNKLIAEAEKAVREGAYVTVGLGVLAFQRAQVRRRELVKLLEQERASFESQVTEGRSGITTQVSELTAQLNDLASQLTGLTGHATGTGERLGDQLGEVGKSLGANLEATRTQILELVKSLDEWAAPARRQLDEQVDAIGELLPASARGVVESVRAAVAAPEARFRAAVGLD